MEIFRFIRQELLDTKVRLIIKLKDISKGKRKPIEERIIKLAKSIEVIDNLGSFEDIYFKEKEKIE